jgi:UDP-GlcNAc3NAcA epimerase
VKVVSVLGARPQFIKYAPVARALENAGIEAVLVHTGQHYDSNMSDVFFDELGIVNPHHHLGIGSGPHGWQTGRMMEALEGVLMNEKPHWVVVFGDTNSTLAGALTAAKLKIPVAHIEAGLRSFNRDMPEEINRILTDHVSRLLFAPTATAVKNLRREGMAESAIALVGDVMFDAALMFAERAERRSRILEELGISAKGFVLATVHRVENTDDTRRLTAIMEGLTKVSRECQVVFPAHPRTKSRLSAENIRAFEGAGGLLIEPVGYLDMVMLERNAAVVATDSGGVQKEAFFCGVQCVTLRDETEWLELVELNWNTLVSPREPEAIQRTILSAIGRQGTSTSIFGNGDAAETIVARLRTFGPVD